MGVAVDGAPCECTLCALSQHHISAAVEVCKGLVSESLVRAKPCPEPHRPARHMQQQQTPAHGSGTAGLPWLKAGLSASLQPLSALALQ